MELQREEKKMENGASKHFVLVHGAGHGAWCWYKVSTLLKSAGHKVSVPDMAASGIHPKQVHEIGSISDYFEPLMALMASLPAEERVVLVGHSMGGVCISAAMQKFPEKISEAVFVTAIAPSPNLTYQTLLKEYLGRQDSFMDSQFSFDEGPNNPPTSFLFGADFAASKLYQLSPPEVYSNSLYTMLHGHGYERHVTHDLSLALTMLRPLRLCQDPIVDKETELTEEKYGSVRRVYVMCDKDNTVKEDFQKWIIENNPMDQVMMISGSDHMCMFSKPQELFTTLQQIANNFT